MVGFQSSIKKHVGLIAISALMLGVAVWWYKGKGEYEYEYEEEMPPESSTSIQYPASNNYPLFMPKPSVGPIWQNLKPYPLRFDYPFPVTPSQQLNLPAYQGHLARIHLS